jgi:uncharacterized protein (DUF1330 family)
LAIPKIREITMKRLLVPALTMLVGFAVGATAINGLHAQVKAPGAYVVVDISSINNPDVFKTLLPKAGPAADAFGAKFIVRTENIVGLDGTPPKRFVVIGFDSMDKAKAWNNSAAQQEVENIRKQSTTSREFIAEAMSN